MITLLFLCNLLFSTPAQGYDLSPPTPQGPLLYQLQRLDPTGLGTSPYKFAIVDIDDANLEKLTLSYFYHIQHRIIVSYLSIGEAEDYRSYWNDSWNDHPPGFLEKENPQWKGNYKVKYWDPAWQELIIKQLDKIIDQGYQGVYFDIIDGFEYFEEQGRKEARQEMIDFVIKLSHHAKSKNPNFLIIPQNGLDLTRDARYLAAIDGVGKEDTWFYDNDIVDRAIVKEEVDLLQHNIRHGKFALMVDYPTAEDSQDQFMDNVSKIGALGFIGNRELNICPNCAITPIR